MKETNTVNFFEWWYTSNSGKPYMTFYECSWEDVFVVLGTGVAFSLIIIAYWKIAYKQIKQALKYKKTLARDYLIDKTFVFGLCGVTGYFFDIVGIWLNLYKLRMLVGFVLAFYAWRFYVRSKQKNQVENILEGEKLLNNKYNSIKETLAMFSGASEVNDIDSEALNSMQKGVWHSLPNGIKFLLYTNEEGDLESMTIIPKGQEFGLHEHSDLCETCKVIYGRFIDPYNGINIGKGSSVTYKPGQLHNPKSDVKTKLKVTFKK